MGGTDEKILAMRFLKLGCTFVYIGLKFSIIKLNKTKQKTKPPLPTASFVAKFSQRVVFTPICPHADFSLLHPGFSPPTPTPSLYCLSKLPGPSCHWIPWSILSLQYRWSFPSPGYSFLTWFPGHHPLLVFFPTLLVFLSLATEMLKCSRIQFLVLLSFLYTPSQWLHPDSYVYMSFPCLWLPSVEIYISSLDLFPELYNCTNCPFGSCTTVLFKPSPKD